MKTLFLTALFVGMTALGHAQYAKGLLILKSERSGEVTSAAEYTNINFVSGEMFKAQRMDGQLITGYASRHLAAHVPYQEPYTEALITKLAKLAETFPLAAPVIRARLDLIQQISAASRASRSTGDTAAKPGAIPKAELGGKTYTNLAPRGLKDGYLSFIHDAGSVSVPADSLNYRGLKNCQALAPELASNPEFVQLTAAYIPSFEVGNRKYQGVRLVEKVGERFKLITDSGPETVEQSEISIADVIELETSAKNYTAYWDRVKEERARKEAARQEELKRLAEKEDRESKERIARMEADAQRQAAAMNALGTMIGGWLSAPTYYVRPY